MKIKINDNALFKVNDAVINLCNLKREWLKIMLKHKKNNDTNDMYNVDYAITNLQTLDIYRLHDYHACKQLALALMCTKKAIRLVYPNDDYLYRVFVSEAENILKLLDDAFFNEKMDLINIFHIDDLINGI